MIRSCQFKHHVELSKSVLQKPSYRIPRSNNNWVLLIFKNRFRSISGKNTNSFVRYQVRVGTYHPSDPQRTPLYVRPWVRVGTCRYKTYLKKNGKKIFILDWILFLYFDYCMLDGLNSKLSGVAGYCSLQYLLRTVRTFTVKMYYRNHLTVFRIRLIIEWYFF